MPESLRQRTAATFFQDLWLFERPWSFNLADIPAAAQQSIHIWHGTGDKQVPLLTIVKTLGWHKVTELQKCCAGGCTLPILGRPAQHSLQKMTYSCTSMVPYLLW